MRKASDSLAHVHRWSSDQGQLARPSADGMRHAGPGISKACVASLGRSPGAAPSTFPQTLAFIRKFDDDSSVVTNKPQLVDKVCSGFYKTK